MQILESNSSWLTSGALVVCHVACSQRADEGAARCAGCNLMAQRAH